MRKILILVTIALLVVTSLVLGLTKDRTNQKNALPDDSSQGEALIGGDFTLTDTEGKTVRDADFRGRTMLVFFGFTHCPDICPVTVGNMSALLEKLGDKAGKVAPIFVTVDPERDTPDVMKAFLKDFDKRIIGLTGTAQQIKDVAGVYRAYYAKNAAPETTDNYSVDHSGFIYLMDSQGKFLKAIPYNTPVTDVLALVAPHIGQ